MKIRERLLPLPENEILKKKKKKKKKKISKLNQHCLTGLPSFSTDVPYKCAVTFHKNRVYNGIYGSFFCWMVFSTAHQRNLFINLIKLVRPKLEYYMTVA